METTYPSGLMWFRRDLRCGDNAALSHALSSCRKVHCAFVFDTAILDSLPRCDRRVEFIRESLVALDEQLRLLSGHAAGGLLTCHGVALDEIPRLARQLGVHAVFANHDDEPQASARDTAVSTALGRRRVAFHTFKDQTIFERGELLTQGGTPYSVFTPYKRAWLAKVTSAELQPHAVRPAPGVLAPRPDSLCASVPTLAQLRFEASNLAELGIPTGEAGGDRMLLDFLTRIDRYKDTRDYPAVSGPSYLGVHLRFGTVSIRKLAREALPRAQAGNEGAATWLSELIWREFYFQVLANFPHVADEHGWGRSFKPEYDAIRWETGPAADALFAAWCEGRTGYPLVDAAMGQINRTGYMHNRLRMVVASFLCKDLGVDWRRGERYFAEKLNDYDLSANNGGWQWASSSGCDAQPFFRIFNPVTQSRKFDPEGKFILRYLPQLAGLPPEALHAPWEASPIELAAAGIKLGKDYPDPVVAHEEARERTLRRYAIVKKAPA
ncbi:MAG: deoxyribodipyrimidine photo-lyase [Ramlibacter sp.]